MSGTMLRFTNGCSRAKIGHSRAWLTLALGAGSLALTSACTSGGDTASITVKVAPASTTMLTCSAQGFTATVSGGSTNTVSWDTNPATSGLVDQNGNYTSPTVLPNPPAVKVVAASGEDPSATGSADVTLATALPGAAQTISGTLGFANLGGAGTYTHVLAAQGQRVYAAWPDNSDPTTALLQVARSDDGGTTWQPAVSAISAAILDDSAGAAGGLECPAIAIDAGDPDVIYALGHVVAENEYGKPLDGSASGPQTELFSVSTDGGATWTTHVLHVGAGGDVCADVASPAADTVVVASPGWGSCTSADDTRDIFVWSDAQRGKGFAKGTHTDAPVEYFAKGYTSALDDLVGDGCTDAHLWPAADGGTDAAGDATESPRLFTDGKGKLCVTYVGHVLPSDGRDIPNVYLQCSTDAGQTFTPPDPVDPTNEVNGSSASGAIAPDGGIAILFTTDGDDSGKLELVTNRRGEGFSPLNEVPTYREASGDRARALNPALTYDPSGILWLAYRTVDSGVLAVDKSCDGGVLFSGATAVDDGSGGFRWPSFANVSTTAPLLAAWGASENDTFTLAP